MGFSGIGPGSLLLILLITVLLFGTKRLRQVGGDLGAAVKGLRQSLEGNETTNTETLHETAEPKPSTTRAATSTQHSNNKQE